MTGTFDEWIKKRKQITACHERRLRALAKAFQPFSRLAKRGLTTTEVCNKHTSILKDLEIPEYKDYWSQTN